MLNTGVLCGKKKDGCPEIGDNVELCAGCKVTGPVKVGNNAVVAPNAVVVKDVPDNAIMAGVPAKVLRIKEEKNG